MKSVILILLLNTVILLGAINVMSIKFRRLLENVQKLQKNNEELSTKIKHIDSKNELLLKRFSCLTDNLLDNSFAIKHELEENKKYHLETRKVIIEESVKELNKHHSKLVFNPPGVYFLDGGIKPNAPKNRK